MSDDFNRAVVDIVASACRIAAGRQAKLYLGNIDIQRDWG
jgi:GDP-D-mannose dehydratase